MDDAADVTVDAGGGILTRLRSLESVEAPDLVDRPGLGGWEPSLLSESTEDRVNRLIFDRDCVDLDLCI